MEEGSNVPFDGARSHELISDQIGVVRGRDVVFGKRAGHVHPNRWLFSEGRVLLGQKEGNKVLDFPCAVLPGDKRWGIREQCWGSFYGGSGFRGGSDLFGCGEDLDE